MKLRVGQVLATGLAMFARRYGQLFLLVVAMYLLIALSWLLLEVPRVRRAFDAVMERLMRIHRVLDWEAVSLGWIPVAILAAAIAIYIVARLRDEPVAFPRALGRALRRAHVVLPVALIVHLATVGVAVFVRYLRWDGEIRPASVGEMASNAVLWIAALAVLCPAIQIAAVERCGVFGSFARAWRLGRGERFRSAAIVALLHGFRFVVSFALFRIMVSDGPFDVHDYWMYAYTRFGVEVVLSPLLPVMFAVLYEKLRAAKEGPAENQLARVFD